MDSSEKLNFTDKLNALGEPTRLQPRSRLYIALFAIGLITCLSSFVLSWLLNFGVIGQQKPNKKSEELRITAPFYAIPFEITCLILSYIVWRRLRFRMLLGPNGFAWMTPSECELFLWPEVKSITHSWTIRRKDGYRVDLTYYLTRDRCLFEELMKEKWLPGQVKTALEAIEKGDRVTFGPLALDSLGVHKGDKCLRYNEVERIVRVVGDAWMIKLYKKGNLLPWSNHGTSKIINDVVFTTVLQILVSKNSVH